MNDIELTGSKWSLGLTGYDWQTNGQNELDKTFQNQHFRVSNKGELIHNRFANSPIQVPIHARLRLFGTREGRIPANITLVFERGRVIKVMESAVE